MKNFPHKACTLAGIQLSAYSQGADFFKCKYRYLQNSQNTKQSSKENQPVFIIVCKNITIEDPIEYVHSNKKSLIQQRELGADTLSFTAALKGALRQDPDVILVGEMRDTETIQAALTAAETGHLVMATLHTNSAPQTIDRIIDTFPEGQQNQIRLQLSSVIIGIISQRLLARLDGEGRVAAFEILIGTPPVQALVRDGKTSQLPSVLETGFKDGMITMRRSLENLVEQGIVDPAEAGTLSLEAVEVESFQ